MVETIDLTASAFIKDGPRVSFSYSMEAEAYDKIVVSIPAGDNETIQLIPVATSEVKFLIIMSDHYDESVTYQVNGAGNSIKLDTPQNYFGQGAVSVLDAAAPPSNLVFTNNSVEDIRLQILVGRSATA